MGRRKRAAEHGADHAALLAELDRLQAKLAEVARAVAQLRAEVLAEAAAPPSSSTDEREAS
jgi:hypothetical protein